MDVFSELKQEKGTAEQKSRLTVSYRIRSWTICFVFSDLRSAMHTGTCMMAFVSAAFASFVRLFAEEEPSHTQFLSATN